MSLRAYKLIERANLENMHLWQFALEYEMKKNKRKEKEIYDYMDKILDVMFESSTHAIENDVKGKIVGGESKKLKKRLDEKKSIIDDVILKGMMYAFSTMETNVSMGKIVAAPTAGSCGILPGAIVSLNEKYNIDREQLIKGLLTASMVGLIIGENASLSGAEGGCQAEVGSASAMSAAAIVYLMGGNVKQCFDAAAISLKNLLGLVCDPVAGLVEAPCLKRNGMGVANAYICAEMALAGIESIIPFDEVVETLKNIGDSMPCCLKETAEGGVAITKTAKNIEKQVFKS